MVDLIQFKEQDYLDAILLSGPLITVLAKRMGCNRGTVYEAMKKWPSIRKALDYEKEKRKDFVESELMKQIKSGNGASTRFFLRTQARDRGYAERTELDTLEDITINFTWDEPAVIVNSWQDDADEPKQIEGG